MTASKEIDMELDFHIEFPSPDYEQATTESSRDDNADVINGISHQNITKIWPVSGYNKDDEPKSQSDKEIVVVLLGWAGSQHKHLAKYSTMYLKRGCIVLRYIAPVKALFVQTGKLPVLANRLVRLLKDLQLEEHPIFFHVFSNGGAFMYSYVLRELSAVQKRMNIDLRGTIFDSAPSPRNLEKCFRAVSSIFENLNVFRYLVATMAVLMIIAQVFWYHLKSAIELCVFGERLGVLDTMRNHTEEIPLKNWLGRLCKMKNHSYLFLYSDADYLIPWGQVEEIADITASHGNNVEKIKFLGSEHVQHYRKYPEEYVKAVTDFIRQTMKNKTNGPTILWEGH